MQRNCVISSVPMVLFSSREIITPYICFASTDIQKDLLCPRHFAKSWGAKSSRMLSLSSAFPDPILITTLSEWAEGPHFIEQETEVQSPSLWLFREKLVCGGTPFNFKLGVFPTGSLGFRPFARSYHSDLALNPWTELKNDFWGLVPDSCPDFNRGWKLSESGAWRPADVTISWKTVRTPPLLL